MREGRPRKSGRRCTRRTYVHSRRTLKTRLAGRLDSQARPADWLDSQTRQVGRRLAVAIPASCNQLSHSIQLLYLRLPSIIPVSRCLDVLDFPHILSLFFPPLRPSLLRLPPSLLTHDPHRHIHPTSTPHPPPPPHPHPHPPAKQLLSTLRTTHYSTHRHHVWFLHIRVVRFFFLYAICLIAFTPVSQGLRDSANCVC